VLAPTWKPLLNVFSAVRCKKTSSFFCGVDTQPIRSFQRSGVKVGELLAPVVFTLGERFFGPEPAGGFYGSYPIYLLTNLSYGRPRCPRYVPAVRVSCRPLDRFESSRVPPKNFAPFPTSVFSLSPPSPPPPRLRSCVGTRPPEGAPRRRPDDLFFAASRGAAVVPQARVFSRPPPSEPPGASRTRQSLFQR